MATETLEITLPASVKDLANLIKKTYNDDEIDELKELMDDGYVEPTKEELIADIREAIEELNLIKAGKAEGRPVEELLNEL